MAVAVLRWAVQAWEVLAVAVLAVAIPAGARTGLIDGVRAYGTLASPTWTETAVSQLPR